jgi:formylmethanofuran dehydrogenase subunit E
MTDTFMQQIYRSQIQESLADATVMCARCGELFPAAGDGYDDLCPTCADASEREEDAD